MSTRLIVGLVGIVLTALAIVAGVARTDLLNGGSGNTENIAAHVAQSMEETLSTDTNYRLHVVKVDIIKSQGNEYQGMATVRTAGGTERDVPVEVTADFGRVMWEGRFPCSRFKSSFRRRRHHLDVWLGYQRVLAPVRRRRRRASVINPLRAVTVLQRNQTGFSVCRYRPIIDTAASASASTAAAAARCRLRRFTAGVNSSSDSPCWIASQACADGRPLTIVWSWRTTTPGESLPIGFAVKRGLTEVLHDVPRRRDQRMRILDAESSVGLDRDSRCDRRLRAVEAGTLHRRRCECGFRGGPGHGDLQSWPFNGSPPQPIPYRLRAAMPEEWPAGELGAPPPLR